MLDLEREHAELREEVTVGSIADQELKVTEFFRIFADIAAENGDSPDLEYCPVLKEGSGGYRIDGYAFDTVEGDGAEARDLYLAVCDFHQAPHITSVNARDVDRAVDGAIRFFNAACRSEFLQNLEEASPAYQLAVLIFQYRSRIRRVRVLLLTNGVLKTRRNVFDTKQEAGVAFHANVLDLKRYVAISSTGHESVVVDFDEDFAGAIECLPAHTGSDQYQSYLFAIPGDVLASVFAAFGNRLLEQNVRTYLQARTSVNKGILRTIADEPEMFFAYNNGVTATASKVDIRKLENGGLAISRIEHFQIVNGGQTTASLLYARDSQSKNVSHVFVQVKLSVVGEDRIEEVVPKISEYANTQNKVSLADLASNSPAQIRIEQLSKEISAPQKAGELNNSRWFYERARGQYKNLFAYKTSAERKRLELMYPKAKLVTKTDLAKYEVAFAGKPHNVCEGAQKCFNRYTTTELKGLGEGTALNAVWFQRAMAKALLFNSLDDAVQRSDWYKSDRGYKAQIVAYAIAACAEGFRKCGREIDLDRIWRDQEVCAPLLSWMLGECRRISEILKNPPSGVRNISEFAKKQFCWDEHVRGKVGTPEAAMLDFGVTAGEFHSAAVDGARTEKFNREIDFDIALARIAPRIPDIAAKAKEAGFASPKNMAALSKIRAGKFNLSKAEKNAIRHLLERLEFPLDEDEISTN